MEHVQPLGAGHSGNTFATSRLPNTPASPSGVVSPEVVRALRGADVDTESTPQPPVQLNVLTEQAPQAQEILDASIRSKIAAITRPTQRNVEHMVGFLNTMLRYDGSARDSKAQLGLAIDHFIRAFYATREEVDGPQDEAGTIINTHNIATDLAAASSTAVAWLAQYIITKHAIDTKAPNAPGQTTPRSSVIPPTIALIGSVLNLFANPLLGRRWIQPALAEQRIIRTLTPTRAGGAVDVDQAITGLVEADRQASRLLRDNESGLDLPATEDAEGALRAALQAYDEASGTTRQRTQLYMPENYIRIARAVALLGAVWNVFGTKGDVRSRLVPVVLIYQLVSYVAGWVANYTWAGPKRDRLLRDGALQVDFVKRGPEIARRLADEGGGEIQTVDTEAWEWARELFKSQKQVRINMAETLVREKQSDARDEMAMLLGMPPSDLARLHILRTQRDEEPNDMQPAETQTLQDLQTHFDTAEARIRNLTAAPDGQDESPAARYAIKEGEHETLTQDLLHLKSMFDAAAKDEPSDAWTQLSLDSKEWLELALSEHETQNFAARYWHYMFKGAESRIKTIVLAHAMAGEVRRDWRKYDPDAFLKFAKAAQMGIGGSLMPLILSAAFGISSATGRSPHVALRGVFSAIPFLLYVACEILQGTLVNATITQREDLLARFPSKRGHPNMFGPYALQGWRNIWRVPEEVRRQLRGRNARGAVVRSLAALEAARQQVQPPPGDDVAAGTT